ncbi:MAG: spheroidene monooxygenase [Burkholderiaceae bacterium]|nr:spheroidene monooxygenase [Burkholderiaceae bacterium]
MLAVIVLVEFKPAFIGWAWSRFVLGRLPLLGTPGLRFTKVLGSGHEGGFGVRPSATRQGLFLIFDTEANADRFLNSSRLMKAYTSRSRELFSCKLLAYSCKGSWSGQSMTLQGREPTQGPIAALTRASIRPTKALDFWRHAPPAETSLGQAEGCLIAVGLGEAPLLRQATFSIWESAEAMNNYARSGAHLQAIRAALGGGHFSESMFVRFQPIAARGVWKGKVFR